PAPAGLIARQPATGRDAVRRVGTRLRPRRHRLTHACRKDTPRSPSVIRAATASPRPKLPTTFMRAPPPDPRCREAGSLPSAGISAATSATHREAAGDSFEVIGRPVCCPKRVLSALAHHPIQGPVERYSIASSAMVVQALSPTGLPRRRTPSPLWTVGKSIAYVRYAAPAS
ncbi:MAG: hypothetical protein RL701_342, partial [Pseudomonadota bacterium]